jgi:lysophospholipase L1-like esterase
VEVDDLRAEGPPGAPALVEDFANHRHAGALLGAALALLAALDGAVALLVASGRAGPGAAAAPALAAANLAVLACAGLALLADAVYFGRLHPSRIDFAGHANRIEYEGQIVPRLAREYPPGPPPPGVRRILVLGTSQTWGSGAARPEDVWVRRLEARLGESAQPGERFELIDAGLPGEISKKVRELFERRWLAWQPELVLVVLGNNDRDPAVLARELDAIAEDCAKRGIRAAFVPEPNSIEGRKPSDLRELEAKHAALRAVAERRGLPVVEVHAALAAERDTGFLWWDRVHLTSYGQERLAEHLFAQRRLWLGFDPAVSRSGP